MLPSSTKLYHVTSEWSDSELSLLLSALKRNRSFSTRELAEFIQTKNKRDVDEKNLQDPQITVPEVKPEGSIDILLQITRHSCTEYYNYSMTLNEVLQRASTWESVVS
ncbi:unnamed protein product [Schistosoma rodhaini]|uniref:Uncharacterized protein n=1 Tax=Schistosoma rodhaini TaxID=6188 RepID=A0AA85EX00_9TREM|nr:unnamed protein product [Schistosoma rodhaini]